MKPLGEHTVAELMKNEIVMVKENASIEEAIKIMTAKQTSSLIVDKINDSDSYGIITRKDLVIEAAENWEGFFKLQVRDLATKPVISIQASVNITHAVRLMRLTGVRRLLVFEGATISGILSNSDVYHAICKSPKG